MFKVDEMRTHCTLYWAANIELTLNRSVETSTYRGHLK